MTIPIWAAVAAVMAILIAVEIAWSCHRDLLDAYAMVSRAHDFIERQEAFIEALQDECDRLAKPQISEMPGWTGKERRTADAHVGYECAQPDPQLGEWS